MNIESDDWISEIDFDGSPVYLPGSTPCGSTIFSSYVYHLGMVSPGSHSISIVVHNCNNGYYENATGMALYGTVNSASGTASITTENNPSGPTCSCLIDVCNTIALADTVQTCIDTSVSLLAAVTGPDSIISISWSPSTGLSDTSILDPIAIVGTISSTYYLTVTSLTPYNLVFNGDFSAGDTGFSSDYTYLSAGLSGTGDYMICTNPNAYYSGWPSIGDHTTGTGNMLVIDGSETLGANFWCETIPVTSGTEYVFSVWIASLQLPLPSDEVTINGTAIGTFTASSTVGAWTEYQVTWNSGSATSANICMTDLNLSGMGNDFTIDDISFQQLCIAKDSIYISAAPKPLVDLGSDTILCSGTPISLHSLYSYLSPSYLWNTGSTTSSISPTITNEYSLQVTVAGCSNYDSVHVTFKPAPIISLGHDISLCQGDSVTLAPFIGVGDSFFWSTGAITTAINISATGSYSIKVDSNGCSSSDTVQVTVFPLPIVTLGPDIKICQGDSVDLSSTGSYTLPGYMWSTGATTPSINVSSAGNYSLIVSQNGCLGSDTINVHVTPLPVVDLGNDTSICIGNQVILGSAQPASASYLWSDGSNGSTLNVSATGSYALTVTDSNCAATDTININVSTIPIVNLGADTSLCNDEVLVLNANVANGSLLWSTGSTSETIEVSQTGIYSVIAENVCGAVGDTISVSFYSCDIWFPSAFSPNGDGLNDIIRVRGTLFAFDHFALSIFNRWGQRVFYTENIYDGWDGKVNNTLEDIGTYFYMITYHWEGKRHMLKGDFQLIR